eukprot:944350-Pelagomonas_calceolata.AAC.1
MSACGGARCGSEAALCSLRHFGKNKTLGGGSWGACWWGCPSDGRVYMGKGGPLSARPCCKLPPPIWYKVTVKNDASDGTKMRAHLVVSSKEGILSSRRLKSYPGLHQSCEQRKDGSWNSKGVQDLLAGMNGPFFA